MLRGGEIINVAGELHHHRAALIRRDLGPQNLRGDIEFHGQPIGNRLMHRLAGEMEGDAALHAGWPAGLQANQSEKTGRLLIRHQAPPLSAPTPDSPDQPLLGRRARMLLAALGAVLALALFALRGGLQPAAPLEKLARQSLDLSVALGDGRPTLVEFYADWCEACQAMAPAMETIEQQHHGQLDVVLLNVDNPRWQPEIDRYEVNGIPQLELFNASGDAIGRALGARSKPELEALTTALIAETPLPQLAGLASQSSLQPTLAATPMAGPRSHG
jgi:thiol-disulfide isomerase/thioredoxin